MTELTPFSNFGILFSKATLWTKIMQNFLS